MDESLEREDNVNGDVGAGDVTVVDGKTDDDADDDEDAQYE